MMKISIVTPSFNQGPYIERTLLSVLQQDWDPIEYVVFDGGSADETVNILKKYDAKIRWQSAPDNGQTDAVNKGIQATSGDIIGWLNSDDVYYPGALRTVMNYFFAHPDVDVVYGMADHIDLNDNPFEEYPTQTWDFERLKLTCFICQPALFFRRSLVAQHGLLDETLNYCMDYEYWLRLGAAGVRFAYLPQKLAGSRLYGDNKTLGARVKVHAEINDMLRWRLKRVPDRWLYNYAHAVVERRYDRKLNPKRFAIEIGLRSLGAAIYWNAKISQDMGRTTLSWVSHAVFGR
jgi:glycosyltransferase involved in cell wall biosynthesis